MQRQSRGKQRRELTDKPSSSSAMQSALAEPVCLRGTRTPPHCPPEPLPKASCSCSGCAERPTTPTKADTILIPAEEHSAHTNSSPFSVDGASKCENSGTAVPHLSYESHLLATKARPHHAHSDTHVQGLRVNRVNSTIGEVGKADDDFFWSHNRRRSQAMNAYCSRQPWRYLRSRVRCPNMVLF